MKLIELLEQTNPLTESYVKEVAKRVHSPAAHDVTEAFAKHRKLTGHVERDARAVSAMILMVEDEPAEETPKKRAPRKKKPVEIHKFGKGEFDPFAHLNLGDMPPIDHKKDCVLTITTNAKMKHLEIWGMSLPAGYSCPFAGICKMLVHRSKKKFTKTGKHWYTPHQETGPLDKEEIEKAVRDNPEHAEVPTTCFSGAGERQYPETSKMRWRNFDLLLKFKGDTAGMADLIQRSIEWHERKHGEIRLFRMTMDGDFFSQEYFDAWIEVAKRNPKTLFYSFTTSIEFWVNRKKDIPKNMRLVASEGSKQADMIQPDMRSAKIVHDEFHASDLGIPIDTDDYLAALGGNEGPEKRFALLVHGRNRAGYQGHTQQRNSELIKALNAQLKHDDIEQRMAQYIGGKKKKK